MKILIWHFRSAPGDASRLASADPHDSAGTDGVSLEIMKRRSMLESMGHEVAVSSAYGWSEFPIADLEFDTDQVMKMMRNLFGPGISDYDSEEALTAAFEASVMTLRDAFARTLDAFGPDLVFVHNILCLPIHPAATAGLARILTERRLPCVAIHHDILSEGAYKFTPTCDLARSLLDEAFPPRLDTLMHWTINTRNQKALRARGVEAAVIHDTIEFDGALKGNDRARVRGALREKYGIAKNDVVLLVGARIVPNKQIEIAGPLVAEVERRREALIGKPLADGETFGADSRVVLVLAGRPERAFEPYRQNLYRLLDGLGIRWIYAGDVVRPMRAESHGLYALYPDVYSMADMVVYPTGWEGFGNQLIEAFAAGLPSIVFEYPVYKEDIGPKGFEIVSLGDRLLDERDSFGFVQVPVPVIDSAAERTLSILCDLEEYNRIARHNAELGGRHFGPDVLREHLTRSLEWSRQA